MFRIVRRIHNYRVMNKNRSSAETSAACFAIPSAQARSRQTGSAIIYVLMAIGLLAALTFAITSDNVGSTTNQSGARMAEDLYSQINLIKSTIVECTMVYPAAGRDYDADGDIDQIDHPNMPYPLTPMHANNPYDDTFTTDQVRNLTCTGAPNAAAAAMFSGIGVKGRFLPPMTNGFTDWLYVSDTDGVRIETTYDASGEAAEAVKRIRKRMAPCETDLNFDSCGARCLTVWVMRLDDCP